MSDSFLERFEQRRKERLEADRAFVLAGETLVHKASVAPEVGSRLDAIRHENRLKLAELRRRKAEANGDEPDLSDIQFDDEALIAAADETILACLEHESHDAWARLRAVDAEYPLNFEEVMSLTDYLIQRVTGIPTSAPAGSSDGRKKTGKPSKGGSSSTAKASAI